MEKLNLHTIAELTRFAIKEGLTALLYIRGQGLLALLI